MLAFPFTSIPLLTQILLYTYHKQIINIYLFIWEIVFEAEFCYVLQPGPELVIFLGLQMCTTTPGYRGHLKVYLHQKFKT